MSFCPKCGAALKVEQPSVAEAPPQAPPAPPYRAEKGEKREKQEKEEKHEKGEKTEKREKQEHGYIGPLIGGLILILVGFIFYLEITTMIASGVLWAFFFVIIGIVIIIGAIYAATMASKRQPQP
jgi:Ca2+/Na+ antiporter